MKSDNIVEGVMAWLLGDRAESLYFFIKGVMMHIFDLTLRQKQSTDERTDLLTAHARNCYERALIEVRDAPRSVLHADTDGLVYNVRH